MIQFDIDEYALSPLLFCVCFFPHLLQLRWLPNKIIDIRCYFTFNDELHWYFNFGRKKINFNT